MTYNTAEINHLIQNRRSIFPKMYTGEPVPKHVIEKMLENANWAPTHKFTEPWRFTVFYEQGVKSFAAFQAQTYKNRNTKTGNFDEAKYLKLKDKPRLASCIIAIGMKRDPQRRVPEMEEIAAVSCAVQNMYLTAAAYGVGCYWSTGGPTFWEEAKPFFNLGPEDKLLGFLFIGMPGKDSPKGNRGVWQDKFEWREG